MKTMMKFGCGQGPQFGMQKPGLKHPAQKADEKFSGHQAKPAQHAHVGHDKVELKGKKH
jgi:hypothetical protein